MDFEIEKPFTVKQAADFLGLKASYLYRLIADNKISYYKPNGGRVYFKKSDLEHFIFRGKVSAGYELQDRAISILTGGAK